jgi:hypothetical protein
MRGAGAETAAPMTAFRWRVFGFHEGLWLVRRTGLRGGPDERLQGDGEGEVLNADLAAFQVDSWFPDGWGDATRAGTLADIASALGEELLWSHDTEAWRRLKGIVKQALRDGRLVAVRIAPPVPGGSAPEQEEVQAERAPRREEAAWIEIALSTDDDPPRPVPFKRYRIELPNGAVREGQLDARGMARLVGIDPGTCQISFPDYDAKRWRRA